MTPSFVCLRVVFLFTGGAHLTSNITIEQILLHHKMDSSGLILMRCWEQAVMVDNKRNRLPQRYALNKVLVT